MCLKCPKYCAFYYIYTTIYVILTGFVKRLFCIRAPCLKVTNDNQRKELKLLFYFYYSIFGGKLCIKLEAN